MREVRVNQSTKVVAHKNKNNKNVAVLRREEKNYRVK